MRFLTGHMRLLGHLLFMHTLLYLKKTMVLQNLEKMINFLLCTKLFHSSCIHVFKGLMQRQWFSAKLCKSNLLKQLEVYLYVIQHVQTFHCFPKERVQINFSDCATYSTCTMLHIRWFNLHLHNSLTTSMSSYDSSCFLHLLLGNYGNQTHLNGLLSLHLLLLLRLKLQTTSPCPIPHAPDIIKHLHDCRKSLVSCWRKECETAVELWGVVLVSLKRMCVLLAPGGSFICRTDNQLWQTFSL